MINYAYKHQRFSPARRRLGFNIHFTVFVLLLPVNWIIWYLTGGGYLWPVWPSMGWGIGVLFHWIGAYQPFRFLFLEEEESEFV